MLIFKAENAGIALIWQKEYCTSVCSPWGSSVCSRYATGEKLVKRLVYIDGERKWNADSVGA